MDGELWEVISEDGKERVRKRSECGCLRRDLQSLRSLWVKQATRIQRVRKGKNLERVAFFYKSLT